VRTTSAELSTRRKWQALKCPNATSSFSNLKKLIIGLSDDDASLVFQIELTKMNNQSWEPTHIITLYKQGTDKKEILRYYDDVDLENVRVMLIGDNAYIKEELDKASCSAPASIVKRKDEWFYLGSLVEVDLRPI
jgi:hypothetical protein